VAPSGERLRGEGRYGVLQAKVCNPYPRALEVVSRLGAIQVHSLFFTFLSHVCTAVLTCDINIGILSVRLSVTFRYRNG